MIDARQNAFVAGFKAEHRELNQMLRAADRRWRDADAAGWVPGKVDELCKTMNELLRQLEHHFAQEEAGGYLEEAITAAPALGPKADRLAAQHPELLRQCRELIARMEIEPVDPAKLAKLHDDYLDMKQLLLEHEHGENQVMQQAYRIELDIP